MNLRHTVFTVALMSLCLATQASTMDEIKSLWHPQGARTSGSLPTSPEDPEVKPLPAKPPVWYRLSNGRQINLADWKVVLFMQGHCPYCHQFDPVLKSLSARVGFGVMAYTIDGQGDASFPDALPAPPEVMKTFFPNLPVATPTTFLVNVNTLGVYAEWAGILLIAGVLSRVFMTYVFNACVGDWLRDGHLQLKDLWNVLMYAIPLIFIALSGGLAVAGGVYAILNSLYTKGQMFILKRKMGKLALQASREGADVRP